MVLVLPSRTVHACLVCLSMVFGLGSSKNPTELFKVLAAYLSPPLSNAMMPAAGETG